MLSWILESGSGFLVRAWGFLWKRIHWKSITLSRVENLMIVCRRGWENGLLCRVWLLVWVELALKRSLTWIDGLLTLRGRKCKLLVTLEGWNRVVVLAGGLKSALGTPTFICHGASHPCRVSLYRLHLFLLRRVHPSLALGWVVRRHRPWLRRDWVVRRMRFLMRAILNSGRLWACIKVVIVCLSHEEGSLVLLVFRLCYLEHVMLFCLTLNHRLIGHCSLRF